MIPFFVVSVLLLDDSVFAGKFGKSPAKKRTGIGHTGTQAPSLNITKVNILGGLDLVAQPAQPVPCHVGPVARCPTIDQGEAGVKTDTWTDCQLHCSTLAGAQSFWWWPTKACVCSDSTWDECPKIVKTNGCISGTFLCGLNLVTHDPQPVPPSCKDSWPQCHNLSWSKRIEPVVDHRGCHVGPVPRCPLIDQGGAVKKDTWTECQDHCDTLAGAQSFWWWPTQGGCVCSQSTWDECPKVDKANGCVSGTFQCKHPPNECYVGPEPTCWDKQTSWTVQATFQQCQMHCKALSGPKKAKAFYWWPTGGGGCSCSSTRWSQCYKELGASGTVSGDFTCTKSLPIPDPPCYNSYAMIWENKSSNGVGIGSYQYEESEQGVQYGIYIDLDTCFKICSERDSCIGVKWTMQNHCWLQSWAFYVQPKSCGGLGDFVYRKEIANDFVPAQETSCPCSKAECGEMTSCFDRILSDDEKTICGNVRKYQGNLSQLDMWRHLCDAALHECAQDSPRCFTNMTLSWEQGLVQHIANTNQGSSAQLLLQRSDRGLSSETPIAAPHAEVLRLPDEDKWAGFDQDLDSKIDFEEFQAMLLEQGYIFPQQELYQLFISGDGDNDVKLCCVNNHANGELKAFFDLLAVTEFCPCQNEFVSGTSLLQGSHMDKSGLEGDLDHAGLDMERLGVDDDLDHVYKRKRCR